MAWLMDFFIQENLWKEEMGQAWMESGELFQGEI